MARSDERRKRTWRFRLNKQAILEVSAPRGATEKQVRRRGRISLVIGTLVAALMVATVAYADNLEDTLAAGSVTNPTINEGASFSTTINYQVQKTGSNNTTFPATVTFALSGAPSWVSLSAGSRTFSGYSDVQSVTVSGSAPSGSGGATYNLTVQPSTSAGNLNTSPAKVDMSVMVNAPTPSDTTPPSIGYVLNPASPDGSNGWYKSDVTLTWTVGENESPSSLVKTGCDDQSITADQPTTTYSCSATSDGGSAGPVDVVVKRDGTPPTISGSASPVPNGSGWNNNNVTVSFTCGDNLSGIASCTPDQTLSAEGAGQSASGTAVDNAGNSATTAVNGINIDKTPPSVACNAASFVLDEPGAAVTATIIDGLSGPLNATESAAADTSSVGSKSVSITGYDNAGNGTSKSCSYTVGYNFDGLFEPVNKPNALNVSKAGQAIPLKWRLTDYFGTPVTSLTTASVTVSGVSCSLGTTSDAVEEYAAGSSGLQNLGDGYYQFNWKTPTSYAGSCKSLNLNLGEGFTRMSLAYFSFKK